MLLANKHNMKCSDSNILKHFYSNNNNNNNNDNTFLYLYFKFKNFIFTLKLKKRKKQEQKLRKMAQRRKILAIFDQLYRSYFPK